MSTCTSVTASSICTSSGFTDFTLRQPRVAFARSRILTNAIETAGVSLRGGLTSPETAIADVIAAGGGGLLTWASSR